MPMTISLSLMPSQCTADIILHSDCADHYLVSSFAAGRVHSPHFLVLSKIYLLLLYVCSSFATPVYVRLAYSFPLCTCRPSLMYLASLVNHRPTVLCTP